MSGTEHGEATRALHDLLMKAPDAQYDAEGTGMWWCTIDGCDGSDHGLADYILAAIRAGRIPNVEYREWRDVVGWEGLYRVSSDGAVASLTKCGSQGRHARRAPLLLSPATDKDGYWRIGLSRNNARTHFRVHCLVLMAFVGPRPDGHEGCHNDGDRSNNRLSNLRWGTPAENQQDRIIHGTDSRGEKSTVAKLSAESAIKIIVRAKRGESRASIARLYGVSERTVLDVINGRTWSSITGVSNGR